MTPKEARELKLGEPVYARLWQIPGRRWGEWRLMAYVGPNADGTHTVTHGDPYPPVRVFLHQLRKHRRD